MPKLTLPIALMVLGTIKLPGEHDFSDAEAEHVKEQLERLGHPTAPATSEPSQLPIMTLQDVLNTLAAFLERGEISNEEVAERLGLVIGMTVDDTERTEEPEQIKEPEAPPQPMPQSPAPPPPPAPNPNPENPATALVIPPAVVKELVKAGFIITKPETIQAADDEALLAVKGMTADLLARVRQITG